MQSSLTMDSSGNRKRRRTGSVDSDDCVPISKRINTLHIEGQSSNHNEQPACNHTELSPEEVLNNNIPAGTWSSTSPGQSSPGDSPPFWPAPNCLNTASSASISQTHQYYQSRGSGSSSVLHNGFHSFQEQQAQASMNSPTVPNTQDYTYSSSQHAVPQSGVYSMDSQLYEPGQQRYPQNDDGSMGPWAAFGQLRFLHNNEANMDYDPELNAVENPHYFYVNRTLFEAHVQRLRREVRSPDDVPSNEFS